MANNSSATMFITYLVDYENHPGIDVLCFPLEGDQYFVPPVLLPEGRVSVTVVSPQGAPSPEQMEFLYGHEAILRFDLL